MYIYIYIYIICIRIYGVSRVKAHNKTSQKASAVGNSNNTTSSNS